MDNLAALFEKKQYQLIINATEGSVDVVAVSYRLNALIALNRFKEAINLVTIHNDLLYQKDPLKCMELHFGLLMHEKKYEEIDANLKKYEEMPYVSQKVEEFLRAIPKQAASYRRKDENPTIMLNEEEANKIFLTSKSSNKIISTIYRLKPLDLTPYLTSLTKLLMRKDVSDDAKTLALILLISKKINGNYSIQKNNTVYHVNPAQIVPPFTSENYLKTVKAIYQYAKDPSIQEIALSLLNQYIVVCYPNEIDHEHKVEHIALAFVALAKEYLKTGENLDEFIKQHTSDTNIINTLLATYRSALDK